MRRDGNQQIARNTPDGGKDVLLFRHHVGGRKHLRTAQRISIAKLDQQPTREQPQPALVVPAAGDPMVGIDMVAIFEDAVRREEAGGAALFEDGPYGADTSLAVLAFPGVELGVDGEGAPDYLGGFGPSVDEGVVA